eukprot:s198_g1.t1
MFAKLTPPWAACAVSRRFLSHSWQLPQVPLSHTLEDALIQQMVPQEALCGQRCHNAQLTSSSWDSCTWPEQGGNFASCLLLSEAMFGRLCENSTQEQTFSFCGQEPQKSLHEDYTFAIKTLGRKGLCQQALNVLESMVHMGPPPNVIHFNAAISACEASGYWEGALMLLQQMTFLGISPDVISFNAAITAC